VCVVHIIITNNYVCRDVARIFTVGGWAYATEVPRPRAERVKVQS